MLKLNLIGGLACVALLCGCNSSDNGGNSFDTEVLKFDAAVQKQIPRACAMLATAHASFVTVAATGTLKPDVVVAERVIYAGTTDICAHPELVNANTALLTLANSYAAIVQARSGVISQEAVTKLKIKHYTP